MPKHTPSFIERLAETVKPICFEAGIETLSVFGSVATGKSDEESDIDLIVKFKEPVSFIELIEIEERFAKALGRRVDLGTEVSLHPLIKESVAREKKVIYQTS